MATVNINYVALPTLKRFHHSDARVRAVLGPVGSGKSSAMIFGEPLLRAIHQSPDQNGVRKTRGVMIRNTYNELTTTTLKTFREWWGNDICSYRSDKPLSATIRFPMSDGTNVECEVIFLAMDKPDDIGKLRSLELTWGYINEASEIESYDILDALNERIGRYPKQYKDMDGNRVGGCDWCGIFLDSNAPDDEHWMYQKFEIERPDGFEIYHQPPAVVLRAGSTPESPIWDANKGQVDGIPAAENVENIPIGWDYYMKMLPGKDYDKVRVMLCGEYGTVAYGKPVFPNYKDQLYYLPNKKDANGKPRDVDVMRGMPIIIGYDPGFKFAAAEFAQVSPMRQLRFFDEFVLQDVSTREFAQRLLMKLRNEYHGIPFFVRCDPAALQHGRTDARTDLDIFLECGLPTEPCSTNSPRERIESMMWFMNQLVDGEPGMVIGSKCTMLRKGLAGRYYYKKISTSGGRETLYKADPVKNEYSHPCDAAQYIAASLLIDSSTRDAAMRATGTGFGSIYAENVQQIAPSGIDGSGIY